LQLEQADLKGEAARITAAEFAGALLSLTSARPNQRSELFRAKLPVSIAVETTQQLRHHIVINFETQALQAYLQAANTDFPVLYPGEASHE